MLVRVAYTYTLHTCKCVLNRCLLLLLLRMGIVNPDQPSSSSLLHGSWCCWTGGKVSICGGHYPFPPFDDALFHGLGPMDAVELVVEPCGGKISVMFFFLFC